MVEPKNTFPHYFEDYEDDLNQYAFPKYEPHPSSISMDSSTVSYLPQQIDQSNSSLVYNISELKWLNISDNIQPSITLNETNYQILLNTVSYYKLKITVTN